ncbi:1-phosphofructokinase family hexose kinase [Foetidibacter luteolus]|uniref:1-phosphofructokinase family hexose kinase n=1 Tax=Foetidibacter luteolus TaxID=2608880 RepID=UPI00129ACD43|nr:1-phosphofructokinase family hexose kinase [Foetidibacter luteolus]
MKNIITITLNPAVDKTTTVKTIVPDKKLRCSTARYEPGGGGVNVSRALQRLEADSTALFLAGGHTGKFYASLVEKEKLDYVAIEIAENTRENFTVVDESNNLQYRFVMDSPVVTTGEWKNCLKELKENTGYGFVVISGSTPSSIPLDFFDELAEVVHAHDAKLVIDTSGETLKQLLKRKVYLAKPNLGELSSLQGKDELLPHEITGAAREIIAAGGCEIIVVSMGAAGAMLITKDEVHQLAAPAVKKRSTVGAGDSMVAGMVFALSKSLGMKDVLRYGIAAGTAATMNHGTELCRRADVERIYAELQ